MHGHTDVECARSTHAAMKRKHTHMYPEMQLNKYTLFPSLAVTYSAPLNVFFFAQSCAPPRTRLSVCLRVLKCIKCVFLTYTAVFCIDPALAAPRKWSTNPQEFTCQVFGPLCSVCTHTHSHTHIPTWDYIHSSRRSSISVGQAVSTLLCVIFTRLL